jgi:hypothetical protein
VYAPSLEILVPPPPPSFGNDNTLLQLRGGPNSDDWIEGLALCILSGLSGRFERYVKALHAGGSS